MIENDLRHPAAGIPGKFVRRPVVANCGLNLLALTLTSAFSFTLTLTFTFTLALAFTLAPSLFAAPSLPATCVAAIRHALDASANWTMERTLPDSAWPLVSTGTVECAIGEGKGIRWRALHPFPSFVEMTRKGLSIEDEDGRSVRDAAKMPRYAELCRAIDAFAAGDDNVFDGMFDVVDSAETLDGGWSANLAPKVREMRRVVEEISLSGTGAPTNAVLRTSNGGVTAIRFEESADAQ